MRSYLLTGVSVMGADPSDLLLAAFALMLVAAWAGDRSARVVTWLAVAALAGAAIAIPGYWGPPASGFGGLFVSDAFAEMRAAAEATTTIKLATGTTNFVTRHPSVVATSIAAVQVLSGDGTTVDIRAPMGTADLDGD